ncbi:MAG: MATE family efflux transporter [Alphaproteobacteria bacterium]|nr:MATE family efflux transporter [Alphaproteobacteria bacterium]
MTPESRKRQEYLLNGQVARVLFTLVIPVIGGMFSVVAFNLTDTYFVSKLGTDALAAMSFTFPAVVFVRGIAIGLGVALSTLISQFVGRKDINSVRRTTTDGVLLVFVITLIIMACGILFMDELFDAMGAAPDILPLVKEYMLVWYLGLLPLMYPMILNHAIRATGETKFSSIVMIVAALVNVVLDPVFIFGFWFIPAMGIKGAALATVLSHVVAMVVSIYTICIREKMVAYSLVSMSSMLAMWRKIMVIAIPAGATVVLLSVSDGIVTKIVAEYGDAAVAAFGAGIKLEMVAMMIAFSTGGALVPFIGQNWGAEKIKRVIQAEKYSAMFVMVGGLFFWCGYSLFASQIASAFSDDKDVIDTITLFLWIVSASFALQGVYHISGISFNAIGLPGKAFFSTVGRVVILYIPLAYIGGALLGIKGIFIGIAIANLMAGIASFVWLSSVLKKKTVMQIA